MKDMYAEERADAHIRAMLYRYRQQQELTAEQLLEPDPDGPDDDADGGEVIDLTAVQVDDDIEPGAA